MKTYPSPYFHLDPETEARLVEIQAHEQADQSETIARIINHRWLSLQAGKQTVAERMGTQPHLFYLKGVIYWAKLKP